METMFPNHGFRKYRIFSNNLRSANRGIQTGPAFCYLWPVLSGSLDSTTKLDIEMDNQRIVYLKNYGMDLREAYRILQVRFQSSKSEVLKAHQNLLKQHDTSQNDSQIAENIKLINKAFELIVMNFESQSDKEIMEQIEQENTPIEIKFDLQMENCENNYDKKFQLPLNLIEPDGSVMRLDKKLEISLKSNFNEIEEFYNNETNDTSNQFEHTELENIDQISKPKIDKSGVPNELPLKPPDLIQSNQIPNISGSITNSVVIVNSSATTRNVDLKTISSFTGKQNRYRKKKTKSLKVHNKKGKVEILFEIVIGKISHYFSLTLEDIYCGCTKKIKINVPDPSDKDKHIDQILCFEIKPSVENDIKMDTTQGEQEQEESSTDGIILTSSDGDGKLFVTNLENISRKHSIISLNNTDNIDNSTDEINENILDKPEQNQKFQNKQFADNFKCCKPENFKLIEQNLELTLTEIYKGCVKSVNIPQNLIHEGIGFNDIIISITIKPRSFGGTKIYWPSKENDEKFKKVSNSFVFRVVEKDVIFTRIEYDIIFTAVITSCDLFYKRKLVIPTLDDDFEKLFLSEEINNASIRKIPNRGFQYHDGANKIGNLLVKFNITESPIDPPIKVDLLVPLEDIMFGNIRKIKIQKLSLGKDEKQFKKVKILEVIIPPGTESGKQIVFSREGDQNPSSIPADIVFHINIKKHDVFTRNGADIEYIARVTQSELYREDTLEIPTLGSESKTVSLFLEKPLSQSSKKRIKSCGFPYHDNPNKRGDIVVGFEIIKETKDPDIITEFELTLENVLNGYRKIEKINRQKLVKYGKQEYENIEIEIEIKPGTLAGTRYRFANLGDEKPGCIPADILFIARDKPHVYFQRDGQNVVHTELITKGEAYSGSVWLETPTLRKNSFFIHEIKRFSSVNEHIRKYLGEGLPKMNNPSKYGDLIVYYEIVENSKKVKKLEIEVEISLEEVLLGHKNKEIHFVTTSIDLLGTNNQIKKKAYINIGRGLKAGETFFFSRRGNRMPGHAPGDVCLICIDKPHPHFKRDGADLIYTAKITSEQAKLHFIDIPTLDNEILKCKINKESIVPGYGLPLPDDPTRRGDLIVCFKEFKASN